MKIGNIIVALAACLFTSSAEAGVVRMCPCVGATGPGPTWSSKCCRRGDKAPPPKPTPPDDSNTCTPTPPSCTGQWCTSCDDVGCIDIDGPGITASLCDGEFSWCTDDACHNIDVTLVDGLVNLSPEKIVSVLASGDQSGGPPMPTWPLPRAIKCPTGYKPYWSEGTDSWRCGRPVPIK